MYPNQTKKIIRERQVLSVAQMNHKVIRSLSKLIEAGFNSEKAILNMSMDDILSLPSISISEIGIINEIQKAVKAGKFITFLGGGEL